MSIRIKRNEQGNCITFEGSSNPVYWNACLSAEIDPNVADSVNVINDVITAETGVNEYEFFQIPFTQFADRDGNVFATAQETVDYINANANVIGFEGSGTDLANTRVCFKLDDTNTSVMLDNGYSYGVNTIKAVVDTDGTIHIKSKLGDITYFTGLTAGNVCDEDDNTISGGIQDVNNWLNELFTVGAFTQVVISDPFSTMVADVDGVDAGLNLVGSSVVDPVGSDLATNGGSNNYAGVLSTETINQAGEYFTFDIRGEGQIGFGLVHTQDSYDNNKYTGTQLYANPAQFAVGNSAHYGFQFSHWFHPTPNGSWTNYGASTGFIYGSGWSNWESRNEWLAGENVKIKVGIDENGYIAISSLQDDDVTWVLHARTSYPVKDGGEYKLGIKFANSASRLSSTPKVHLLEEEAPVMNFRFIESPDGTYQYPLFATEEEANYYDQNHTAGVVGTGTSHTHTYADDPTNTTWYMPDTGRTMTDTEDPSTGFGAVGNTFMGNTITWTEITSLTNADLTPPAFSNANLTYEEGTVVNMPLMPVDVTYSQSATISPSGSGLVYNTSTGMLQGTLSDVGSDTVYTITVTRANSYGSSTGSFTITATDVAPVQTHTTPWTKALDFSGNSERAQQVSSSSNRNAIKMSGLAVTVGGNATAGYTTSSGSGRPWATAIVFSADYNASNQHIWNSGEGSGSSDDNIYLRLASDRRLYFGWGRSGSLNELYMGTLNPNISWYAAYIAHTGERLSGNNATPSNLADCFDVRLLHSGNSFTMSTYNWSNDGTNTGWNSSFSTTGGRMDRQFTGDFTIGGRGANRNFHGKVASMVVTTLKNNVPMPTDAEIHEMITDPQDWIDNYKVGQSYRLPWQGTNAGFNFARNDGSAGSSTQVWIMGDGGNDSYSNMIRNRVQPNDQNNAKLNLISMVSNDIQNVTISGLS